jgi:hypothetical protein
VTARAPLKPPPILPQQRKIITAAQLPKISIHPTPASPSRQQLPGETSEEQQTAVKAAAQAAARVTAQAAVRAAAQAATAMYSQGVQSTPVPRGQQLGLRPQRPKQASVLPSDC